MNNFPSTETSGDQAPSDAEIDALAAPFLAPDGEANASDCRAMLRLAVDRWCVPQSAPAASIKARLMAAARREALNWGDRVAIGQAIAALDSLIAAPQLVERKAQPVSENGATTNPYRVEPGHSRHAAWNLGFKGERPAYADEGSPYMEAYREGKVAALSASQARAGSETGPNDGCSCLAHRGGQSAPA